MDQTKAEKYEKWKYRAVVAWASVGIVAVFLIVVRALGVVGQAVELLVVGLVVGFICSTPTNKLENRGVPRSAAALISVVLLVVIVVGVLVLLLVPALGSLLDLLRTVPDYLTQASDALSSFWESYGTSDNEMVQDAVNTIADALANVSSSLASGLVTQISNLLVNGVPKLADHLVAICLGFVLGFWFAKDYPKMMREVAIIAGPERGDGLILMFAVLARSVGGYMYGVIVTSAFNGVLVFICLSILGHPYAGLMGVITFVMQFIPVVGPSISAFISVLLALFTGGLPMAFWALVIAIVCQNLTDNVLQPVVMRSAVKIHPAMSLTCIFIGSCLGGAVGMLLAVPAAAIIKSFFVYYFETRTGRQIVSEDGAFFPGRRFHDEDGNIQPAYDTLDDDRLLKESRLFASLRGEPLEESATGTETTAGEPDTEPEDGGEAES